MRPIDPRLLRYSRSSRGFILITVFIAVSNAALSMWQALLLSSAVVDIFQHHFAINFRSRIIAGLITLFLLRASLNLFSDWISSRASTKIRNELRTTLLHSSLHDGSEATQRVGSAQLSILATKGINDLDGYFSKFLPQLLIATVVPISVGTLIIFKDWRSGLIALFTVPLIPLFGIIIGKYTASATSKKLEALGALGGYFLDLLAGINTLKVYGRDHLQSARIKEVGGRYRKETMKVLKISFLSSLALELVATLSVALMAVSIGLRLVDGRISLQTGVLVLILAPEVYWPIRQVASYFHAASDGIAVFEELYEHFEEKPLLARAGISDLTSITWSELTINYPGREVITLPQGQVKRGSIHSIVGVSGSGKSTFAKILLGFLRPTSGEIIISTDQGDISLEKIDNRQWRSLVSWLPQEPKFPVGTVGKILRQSKPDASDEELIAVLATTGLFMQDLPDGLSTTVGSQKASLSIGQLRKVGLARAILKPAPILILDEPSASVDDISEESIGQLITTQSSKGRIIFLISHRELTKVRASSLTQVGEF